MQKIPDLKGCDGQILYILGNGFDLYHGLNSRYCDFCTWLEKQGKKDFVELMEEIFPLENNEFIRWCNFEKALGEAEVFLVYGDFRKADKDSNNPLKRPIVAQKVVNAVSSVIEEIRPLMKEWASQIKYPKKEEKLLLSKNDWYLTFNYTKTLEDFYSIPQEHVCHIHGCIDDYGEIITGHNTDIPDAAFDDPDDADQVARKNIVSLINGMKKNYDVQVETNIDFFYELPDIKDVVVIGHSLDAIDHHYFKKIFKEKGNDVRWHFSVYNRIDHHRIYRFLQDSQITLREDPFEFKLEKSQLLITSFTN